MQTFTAHHDGIEIAYQRFGSTGDPLLLIMGIGADMLYWRDDFCKALVDAGFQVTRFDNRDSGDSTHLERAGVPNIGGSAAIPIPRPTGSRTWPTTPRRSSTPSAGPMPTSWGIRWEA
jgi:pimeloyl-ACP methyl ester carboxylesterase